ncbi:hypothetical protein [Microcoleus sp.]|uniref:hypothetical protein n=1 Tax=Microcoleus sp. TaxID=44472 RepID=UPI0035941A2F
MRKSQFSDAEPDLPERRLTQSPENLKSPIGELPTVKRSTAMTGASRFTRNRVRQDRNLATTTYIPSTGSSTNS